MATNESDLLGRLAEQEFSTWATRGDITVNKVEVDRHGWDFILQMPYRSEARSAVPSLDKMGPELTCKVQVKSTEQAKNSCDDINLENWSRMISEPVPWFVAILIYEARNLKEAFLVHVDEKLIARALIRLRQISNSDRDSLHKKFMTIAWTEADRIDVPFHEGLIRLTTAAVGNGIYDYVEKKKRLYQTLGYDDRPAQGKVTFQIPVADDPDSLWRSLADHALGLAPNMPVSMIDLNEVRFGISTPIQRASGKIQDCRIEDPKVDTGQISFHNKKCPAKFVSIDCNFYHAGIVFPFLPENYRRIRIQTRFFSIVLDPLDQEHSLRVSVLITPDQEESIGELLKYARFVILVSDGGYGDAFFRLSLKRNINMAGRDFPIANASFPEEVIQTARTVEQLWDVLRFFDIDGDTKLSLTNIWEDAETIKFFHAATKVSSMNSEENINFSSAEDLKNQQVAVVFGGYIVIETYAIVVIHAFIGKCNAVNSLHESPDLENSIPMNRYEIINLSKELLRHEKYLWEEGTTIPLEDMAEECCQRLAKRVHFVMAPQLQKSYKSDDQS